MIRAYFLGLTFLFVPLLAWLAARYLRWPLWLKYGIGWLLLVASGFWLSLMFTLFVETWRLSPLDVMGWLRPSGFIGAFNRLMFDVIHAVPLSRASFGRLLTIPLILIPVIRLLRHRQPTLAIYHFALFNFLLAWLYILTDQIPTYSYNEWLAFPALFLLIGYAVILLLHSAVPLQSA